MLLDESSLIIGRANYQVTMQVSDCAIKGLNKLVSVSWHWHMVFIHFIFSYHDFYNCNVHEHIFPWSKSTMILVP